MPDLAPTTIAELADAVRSAPRVLAVGARTKPRLSAVDAPKITTRALSGIVEYEPEEFTFTARAGTPVAEIAAALAAKRQHLPFDPMLLEAGSTLGGAVASGLSGPGRLRFGGVRDFILGVRFVDGAGRILRMGGKVVKNAAGFDVPKFMVGSLGRYGVLAEISFKVFPAPVATRTLEFAAADVACAVQLLRQIPLGRWEPRALDYDPDARLVHLRLGGPDAALEAITREILARWPGRVLEADAAESLWRERRELLWTHAGGTLLKLAYSADKLTRLGELRAALPGMRLRVSAAGDLAFLSTPPGADWDAASRVLRAQEIPALTLRGDAPLRPRWRNEWSIAAAVKQAMDAEQRFPGIEE